MNVIAPTGAASFRSGAGRRNFDGICEVWVFDLGHEWMSLNAGD
jgi:hypothetical protein